MEYITGVITKTSNDVCVVFVTIDGAPRLFSFNKSMFYNCGMKCDGNMSNILEEGMEVGLCYKISYRGTRPVILSVWLGGRPQIADPYPDMGAVYDQSGNVSSFVGKNILVRNNTGSYTVIGPGAVYRDGVSLRDVRDKVNVDDEVNYDAVPWNFDHKIGASFRATCAWIGAKPDLVNRFGLRCAEELGAKDSQECALQDMHGTVVTIPNDVVAITDVQLESGICKVLLFRRSFEVYCESIREVVGIGDVVRMRVGCVCIFPQRKQWYALRASKDLEEVAFTKVNVMKTSNDVKACVHNLNVEAPVQDLNNAKLPLIGISNKFEGPIETSNDVGVNCVTDILSKCFVGISAGTVQHGPTEHFEKARKEVQTDFSALRDMNKVVKLGSNNGTGATLSRPSYRYVGLGMKTAKRREEVQNVLEVPNFNSTHSPVLKEGSNSSKLCETTSTTERNAPDRDLNQESVLKGSVARGRVVGTAESRATKRVDIHRNPSSECIHQVVHVTENLRSAVDTGRFAKSDENVANGASVSVRRTVKLEDSLNFTGDVLSSLVSELNGGLDVLNNNNYVSAADNIENNNAPMTGVLCCDSSVLYSEPPLSGVISRFALDYGCISLQNFKIFVKPDHFFIDGVMCPVKHFIMNAVPGKSRVNFEAVLKSDTHGVTAGFSHEATCAWVGEKPSLVTFAKYLPPPNFYLLELDGQDFSGVVSKLYFPDSAFIVINGDATAVIAHVSSFVSKPRFSKGNLITDCIKVNDHVVFKVQKIASEPNLLFAREVRILVDNRGFS